MADVQREGNKSYGKLSPKDKAHYHEVAKRINSQEAKRRDAVI